MYKIKERADFSDLDSTKTFRTNSELKKQFEVICKANYSNMSRELNAFMRKVVEMQRLDIENHEDFY